MITEKELVGFVQGYLLINQESISSSMSFNEACSEMLKECRGKSKPQLQEFYNLNAIELEETIALGGF